MEGILADPPSLGPVAVFGPETSRPCSTTSEPGGSSSLELVLPMLQSQAIQAL